MKGIKGFQKGHKLNMGNKYRLGHKHTDEAKRKISQGNKGKIRSEKIKKKISLRNKGNEYYKLRKSNGNKGHNKGYRHLEETKRKISEKVKGRFGENAANWQGGKVKPTLLERWSEKNKQFRQFIFERDDFTCQRCGKRGGYLHCHHLKEWAKYPELRYKSDNCITLCKECHYNLHRYSYSSGVKTGFKNINLTGGKK